MGHASRVRRGVRIDAGRLAVVTIVDDRLVAEDPGARGVFPGSDPSIRRRSDERGRPTRAAAFHRGSCRRILRIRRSFRVKRLYAGKGLGRRGNLLRSLPCMERVSSGT